MRDKYIEILSDNLKEYCNGNSYDQLKRIAQFAKEFSLDEILEQPVPKIPLGTIIIIIKKCSSHKEMLWYVEQTYKNRLSRS